MFGGFSLKSALYPAEKVIDTLVSSLKIDQESIDSKALVESLNQKEECTMQHPKVKIDSINDKLKLKQLPISISALNINSITLLFPKSFLKSVSTLRVDGLQLDLQFDSKDANSYPNDSNRSTSSLTSSSSSSSPLMKVINMFIRNIKLAITNVHIRIFIGKEISYCLMIKEIVFDANDKVKIDDKEKVKFVFLHNKLITIKQILLKENNSDNDKQFFNSSNDSQNLATQTAVYITNDSLCINHDNIIIDFNHDIANKDLLISTSNMPLNFECIVNKKQIDHMIIGLSVLNRLFAHMIKAKALSNLPKEQELQDITPQPNVTPTPTPTPTATPTPQPKEEKPLDFFGFAMNTISFDISVSSSYIAIIDNLQEPKAKIWMIYENHFKSYYDIKDTSATQYELIQKHLLYHNENFLIAYIESMTFKFKANTVSKQTESQGAIKAIDVRFIQPNQVKNKKDILIIKNTEANDLDKLFNEHFFKHFFSVIKYGAYTYPLAHLDLIELKSFGKSIHCSISQILVDFNPIIMCHLIHLYKINQLIDINFEDGNRIKDIKRKLPFVFEIAIAKINLRIMTNKKNLKLYQKFYEVYTNTHSNANVNKERIYYNESYQQHFNVTLNHITYRHSSLNSSASYGKVLCSYANNNLVYPILFLINDFNNNPMSDTNTNNDHDQYILMNKREIEEIKDNEQTVNVITISSKINKVLLFYNHFLSRKVFSYVDLLRYSIQMLLAFLSTDKIKSINNYSVNEIRLEGVIKEIQLIVVAGINIPKQRKDITQLIDDNERPFKLLCNPMIKGRILGIEFGVNTNDKRSVMNIGVNDIKLMIRKGDNRFGRDNKTYQLLLDDSSEEDNFEFITYNPTLSKDCLKAQIELIEETKEKTNIIDDEDIIKKSNDKDGFDSFIASKNKKDSSAKFILKGQLDLNEFALVPLPLKLFDIIDSFELMKNEANTANSLITKSINYSSEVIEVASYEKFEPIHANSNSKTKLSYDVSSTIHNLLIDLYSDCDPHHHHHHHYHEDRNSNKKDKMRLITQMNDLTIRIISNSNDKEKEHEVNEASPSITMKLSQLNTIFMKNLEMLTESTSKLNDHTETIANENSFWRTIGFALIFSCSEISIDSNPINSNIFINSINVLLCYDSFKFLIKFISQIKRNIKQMQSLFEHITEEDKESIITDLYQFNDYNNTNNSYLEYRSINQIHSEKNTRLLQQQHIKYDLNNNNNSSNNRQSLMRYNNKPVTDTVIQFNDSPLSTKPISVNFLIHLISVSFFQGEDFNFQGRYTSTITPDVNTVKVTPIDEEIKSDSNPHSFAMPNEKLQKPITKLIENNEESINAIKEIKRKPIPSIENINKRDQSNSITILLNKIEGKNTYYKHSDLVISTYLSIQNATIEDNLLKSKYKKLFSRYDFEDNTSLLFATKANIYTNANGQNDLKAIIDLAPLSIYLDQHTFKFLLDFFYYNQQEIASHSELNEINEDSNNNQEDNNNINYYTQTQTDQILETQTISQINPIQYKNSASRLNRSIRGYSISKLIINSCFINFNYFPHKFNFNSSDETATYELINLVSIENMTIMLKEVKLLSALPLEKLGKYLSQYWMEDIKENQMLRSFLKSVPIMRNFNNIFSGFLAMANIPIESIEKKIPIEESLVSGVRCFVAAASSEVLKLGESVTGFFKKIGRVPQTNDNGFRQLLYKINSMNKKRDMYYLKEQ